MPSSSTTSPTARERASAASAGASSTDLTAPGLHEAVEHLGGALANAGLARLPARVFAALMATPDGRLTSAELATVLEVSPAGVSGAVRYLSQLRMIRRERERGSRRDVYVVMDDAWHDMLMQYDQLYAPILAALGGRPQRRGGGHPGRRADGAVRRVPRVRQARDGRHRRPLGRVQGLPRLTDPGSTSLGAEVAAGATTEHPTRRCPQGRVLRWLLGRPLGHPTRRDGIRHIARSRGCGTAVGGPESRRGRVVLVA